MKILVTGGNGFIGKHVVNQLISEGHSIVLMDINKETYYQTENVVTYPCDIRNHTIETVFKKEKPDVVIHLAAQVSVSESVKDPLHDCHQNIAGTVNVLEACRKYKVNKIIFASSAAVYGNPPQLPITEKTELKPESFYGLSKKTAEEYIILYHSLYGLTYSILRFSNVYGMGQTTEGEAGVVSIFIENALMSKPVHLFGDGQQTRDFIFVKDVANAVGKAVTAGDNQILNISSFTSISVLEFVEELKKHVDNLQVAFLDKRAGDIEHSILENKVAIKELEWVPNYSFSEGIALTIASFK